MATVRVKYRASSVDMREGTLYYQIIHNRVVRQINTDYKLYAYEWNADEGLAVIDKTSGQQRTGYLTALNADVCHGLSTLADIISGLEQSGKAYTSDDVTARYAEAQKDGGFLSLIHRRIIHLQRAGRRSAASKLDTALRSVKSFLHKEDIPFEEVTPDLMEEYEGWLRDKGDCLNTVSFYMRQLHPAYALAVERGMAKDIQPFRHVYTGIDNTVKRAISKTVLRKIQNLDLSGKPHLDRARDLFFFSLFTRGMSFVDMCHLKKTDLKDGMLCYRRQKTNHLMQVKWEKPMQRILDRLGKTDGIYLLPIIKDTGTDVNVQCVNALHRLNRNLKTIGKMAGLQTNLTSYVARHTWASLMQSHNEPLNVISKGLGHNSEATTKIYLANLDTSDIDRANAKILDIFKRPNG